LSDKIRVLYFGVCKGILSPGAQNQLAGRKFDRLDSKFRQQCHTAAAYFAMLPNLRKDCEFHHAALGANEARESLH